MGNQSAQYSQTATIIKRDHTNPQSTKKGSNIGYIGAFIIVIILLIVAVVSIILSYKKKEKKQLEENGKHIKMSNVNKIAIIILSLIIIALFIGTIILMISD